MEIRLLNKNDVELYRAIRLEALKNSPEAFESSYQDEVDLCLSELESRIVQTSHSFVVGAFSGGNLLGIAGFVRQRKVKISHKGFIWGMYVSPGKRVSGVGAKMLSLLLNEARNVDGLNQIQLTVVTQNSSAIHFYKKMGFLQYALEPDALRVNGEAYDEAQMHIRLS